MPNTPIAPVAAPAAIASTGPARSAGPAPDPRPHRADGGDGALGGGVPSRGVPAGPRPHGAGEPAADATRESTATCPSGCLDGKGRLSECPCHQFLQQRLF